MLGNVGTTDPRNITLAPLMGGPRGEPQLPPRPMARTLRNEPERAAVPRTPAFAIPPVPRLPQQARALGQAPSRPTAPPDGRAVTVTPARPPASGIMVPGASFGGYLPQQASPPREAQPERRSVPRSPAFAIPQAPRLPQQARALEQAPVRRPAAPASRATAVAPLRVPASGIMVPGTSLGGYAPQRAPSPRDALPERRARAAEIEVPRGYSMPTPVERPTYESPRESRSQRDFSRAAPRVSRPEARIDGARAWSSMQRAAERRVTERRRDR